MARDRIPNWAEDFQVEEWEFVRNFLLTSGSLKEMASIYNVTYPTMRLRLDRLIERISQTEQASNYPALIKQLALDNKIDLATAKLLLDSYESERAS